MAQDYQASKKTAVKIISILAVITIVEVAFALLGKGYIIDGVHFPLIVLGGIMIIMSIIKAYLIVYEFMHMKYEVPALMKSVLLPTLLLVWAVIAFLAEGSDWGDRRDLIKEKNEASIKEAPSTGMLYRIK
ncbi:MAG: cytochrome c oxidase subunit 4 [Saprospiraceae bacterium]|jgi:cytochrome c oxidase subunit 4